VRYLHYRETLYIEEKLFLFFAADFSVVVIECYHMNSKHYLSVFGLGIILCHELKKQEIGDNNGRPERRKVGPVSWGLVRQCSEG
jgi:hypothetical protein